MEREVAGRSGAGRVAELVDRYARRVYPAVLEQHGGASVCSPLGVWLLLAACATAARDGERAALEDALGCSAEEADELLAVFMAAPPEALKAAIAVWVRVADATEALAGWVRGLPSAVESGLMPSQQEADAWAEHKTLGLIRSFPLAIDALTRVVLASALATQVSWRVPFDVVPAAEHLAPGSPWRTKVKRLLWDGHGGRGMILETRAAGVVAVHLAVASEDLTVISVSADPGVARAAVLDAAHEVAASWRRGSPLPACSLFDLPLGAGHSWLISEPQVARHHGGHPVERIVGASMPAWHVESRLDLKASELFGSGPALEVMRQLIGPLPGDETHAVQAAVASFTRYGFRAAAITTFAIRASARAEPERTAILRFDHPYAAVAIAGKATPPNFAGGSHHLEGLALAGLPVFSAWIEGPQEAELEPPPASPAADF
jgi:Serpin (serine protease inhibitor)